MEIDIDLNKRIDWIKARVSLDGLTEQYIRLQMQEAVIETIGKVRNLTIPRVSNFVCPLCKSNKNTDYGSDLRECQNCGKTFKGK